MNQVNVWFDILCIYIRLVLQLWTERCKRTNIQIYTKKYRNNTMLQSLKINSTLELSIYISIVTSKQMGLKISYTILKHKAEWIIYWKYLANNMWKVDYFGKTRQLDLVGGLQ